MNKMTFFDIFKKGWDRLCFHRSPKACNDEIREPSDQSSNYSHFRSRQKRKSWSHCKHFHDLYDHQSFMEPFPEPPPPGYPMGGRQWAQPYWQHSHYVSSTPAGFDVRVDCLQCEEIRHNSAFESHGLTHTRTISPPAKRARVDGDFTRISDQYSSFDQVSEALASSGLESSNLIVGIDFTKSNEWTGKYSYGGHSLHDIAGIKNPYEQAISIVGETLAKFDDDNQIPCFGFGDVTTHDKDVFGFYSGGRPCNGFQEVLARYHELVPHLKLSGPTSFAPIIEMAMTIVEKSGGQYHVLLIIADGQVTRSVDTDVGRLSPQEKMTIDAIVKASKFPLSIILVGVGDGPWDMMKKFDDNIPARSFDNFQFVNFTEIMAKPGPQSKKETEFALAALMEIPLQYKATIAHGILGHLSTTSPKRIPLPPPLASDVASASSSTSASQPMNSTEREPLSITPPPTETTNEPASVDSPSSLICSVCLVNRKNVAFGCGHQTCHLCEPRLRLCPICRSSIEMRIRLY